MFETALAEPLASILNTSIDAVFVTTRDGTIVWVNGAAENMFGWSGAEMRGRNIALLMPPPVKNQHDSFLAAFRPGRGVTHVLGIDRSLDAVRRDGTLIPVEIGISTFELNGDRYFAGFVRDISERRAAGERLRFLATHDQITGLPNGMLFVEELKAELARRTAPAVIVITPVGFWRVAERHGRSSAEHMIRMIAKRLRDAAGPGAFVGRIHGESFAVMTLGDPMGLAKKLCDAVSLPIAWGSVHLHLGAAAGIATSRRTDSAPDPLLQDAHSAASYAASRSPWGGISLFTEDLGRRIAREALMEERLREAISQQTLTLALQPKVRARDGSLSGAEALARWHDDVLGEVPPSEFVPLAERTGLIGDLGRVMLRLALMQLADWQRRSLPLTMAINISAVDLRQPDLALRLADAIRETGCDPVGIVIELTESALIDDPEQATERLHAIKALGVSLSLDDFGTGYSSLSYLRHFPIDSLKIDRSFVIDTPDIATAAAVAHTVVALAKSLGMKTIAEGVETEAQASFLRDIGVDVFQGFLFGRPLTVAQFADFALSHPAS